MGADYTFICATSLAAGVWRNHSWMRVGKYTRDEILVESLFAVKLKAYGK
mgnify:FL=1|jgi:hypothetical protein